MPPANQRPGKPDKLSQGMHNQTSYPRVQWENTLDKRDTTESKEKVTKEAQEREQQQQQRGMQGQGTRART